MGKPVRTLQSIDLKETNRLTILEMIKKNVCSRAEIAANLGMSRPAVSSLVGELIEEGLVIEVGRGESALTGGKPPILLTINKDVAHNIVVYFNGEWFEVALTNLSSEVILSNKKSIKANEDYEVVFNDITEEINALKSQARSQGLNQKILACGIVLKGLVNTKTGVMTYSATLPTWKDIPVAEYFKSKLGLPVFVENDARANTLCVLNDPKYNSTSNTLVYINVGVGIGTGVVINNEIYRGAFEEAVIFAHTTVLDNGPLCSCGNKGCWESLASVSAFLKQLSAISEDYSNIDIDQAIKKYFEGDEVVKEVLINYTGYWLGVGIANILRVFNPECIVIQGQFTKFGDELNEKIKDVVNERTLPVFKNTRIYFSEMNPDLNVQSASEVVKTHFFSRDFHRSIWNR